MKHLKNFFAVFFVIVFTLMCCGVVISIGFSIAEGKVASAAFVRETFGLCFMIGGCVGVLAGVSHAVFEASDPPI